MGTNELLSEEDVLKLISEEFGNSEEVDFDFSIPNANNGLVGC